MSMPAGTWPLTISASFDGAGALLDDLQLEQARRSDDALRALDVGDAGQLHENLIAVRPAARCSAR